MNVFALKKAMRKDITVKLRAMDVNEIRRQGDVVQELLLRHPSFLSSRRVGVYVHMAREMPTDKIIQALLHPQSNKMCFVPKFDPVTEEMKMLRIRDHEDFIHMKANDWNILEPSEEGREEAIETGGLDLIICPGLGFDRENRRLGRGKGYYDRYLTKLDNAQDTPALKIGLALSVQMVDVVPTTSHDIILDEVLYERSSDSVP
jgi:5-formyltetrahydrofolate cyclo-ligase